MKTPIHTQTTNSTQTNFHKKKSSKQIQRKNNLLENTKHKGYLLKKTCEDIDSEILLCFLCVKFKTNPKTNTFLYFANLIYLFIVHDCFLSKANSTRRRMVSLGYRVSNSTYIHLGTISVAIS